MTKRQIIITVEGGVVQYVEGIPADVEVIIHDYDVEASDESDLNKDDDGNWRSTTVYASDDNAT